MERKPESCTHSEDYLSMRITCVKRWITQVGRDVVYAQQPVTFYSLSRSTLPTQRPFRDLMCVTQRRQVQREKERRT